MGNTPSTSTSTSTPCTWISIKTKTAGKNGGLERSRKYFILSEDGLCLGGVRGSPPAPPAAAAAHSESETLAAEAAPGARERTLRTSDPGLFPQHISVRLEQAPAGPATLAFTSAGRAYFQIVQAAGPFPLTRGATLKMGACSLQVDFVGQATGSAAGAPPPAQRASPIPASSLQDQSCYICMEGGGGLTHSFCPCAKPVHGPCLHRWVTQRRSRLCSICKAPLPLSWLLTVLDPPLCVLRVVRHVRGLRWGAQREYIVSFAQRPQATIGYQHYGVSPDVGLPDHSISRLHAALSYIRTSSSSSSSSTSSEEPSLAVADLGSATGTYLLLPSALPFYLPLPTHPGLAHELVYTFKCERTQLTLKLQQGVAGRPPWGALAALSGRFRWLWGGGSSSSSSTAGREGGASTGGGSTGGGSAGNSSSSVSPPPSPSTASARIARLNQLQWVASYQAAAAAAALPLPAALPLSLTAPRAPSPPPSGTSTPLPTAPSTPHPTAAPAAMPGPLRLPAAAAEKEEEKEEEGAAGVAEHARRARPAREVASQVLSAGAADAPSGALQLAPVGSQLPPPHRQLAQLAAPSAPAPAPAAAPAPPH